MRSAIAKKDAVWAYFVMLRRLQWCPKLVVWASEPALGTC